MLLTPVAVTKDNINDTIIKDGFWTASADLHRAVRGRLQGGRNRVGDSAGPGAPRPARRSSLNERTG